MKHILSIVLLFIGFLGVNAQNTILTLVDEDDYPAHFLVIDYVADSDTIKTQSDFEGKCYLPQRDSIEVIIQSDFFADTTFFVKGDTKVSLKSAGYELGVSDIIFTSEYEAIPVDSSTYIVKVIGQKDIENSGAVNLKDVLQNQSNIRIAQDNVLGSQITMQGMSGENVKIMIDGVPIIGRQDGNLDLNQINLDDIERIEIIEGPLSVEYGTNALAGTINLITKKNKKKTLLKAKTYYESVGQYNLSAAVGKNFKNNGFKLNVGRNYFNGFTDSLFEDGSKPRSLTWKPKEQYFTSLSFNQSIDKSLKLRLANDFFHEKVTNRGNLRPPLYITAFDQYYYTIRNTTTINVDKEINESWKFRSTNSYNYYQRKTTEYFKDLTTLEETLTGEENQSKSEFDLFMFRGTFTNKPDSSQFSYQLGYDINLESTRGKRIEGQYKRIDDFAAFGSFEYYKDDLVIRPGVRISYNSAYKASITPSINIKKRILKRFTARASYARGFRSPTLKELYLDFVDLNHDIHGNPDLNPEVIDAFRLGLTHKSHIKKYHVKTELVGFYNTIKDKIDLVQREGSTEYYYQNIDRYKTLGAQVNVTTTFKQWKLHIGSTYTGVYNEILEGSSYSKFNYTPDLQCNLTKDFKKLKASVSWFYKYNGRATRYFINANDEMELGFIDPYHLSDVTINKKLFKNNLGLVTGVKNLFDVTQVNSSSSGGAHSSGGGATSIGWGRTVFVSLEFYFINK